VIEKVRDRDTERGVRRRERERVRERGGIRMCKHFDVRLASFALQEIEKL